MNILDSSGWLEYFVDGPNADSFWPPLQDIHHLIVPTISIYEVFKVVLRETDEDNAFQAIALMEQGIIVDLTSEIAMQAAKISHNYKIPMADSIILSTSYIYEATLWTQDDDFKNLPGVNYFQKKQKSL